MIAVYLAMIETDEDRDKFMKLYESYEKKLFAVALRILENLKKRRMLYSKRGSESFSIGSE